MRPALPRQRTLSKQQTAARGFGHQVSALFVEHGSDANTSPRRRGTAQRMRASRAPAALPSGGL